MVLRTILRRKTMDKKKREQAKNRLTNMQEILYGKEFRRADRMFGKKSRNNS